MTDKAPQIQSQVGCVVLAAFTKTQTVAATSFFVGVEVPNSSTVVLSDGAQAWFETPAWLAGESEADQDIVSRRGTFHNTDEDFLSSL